MPTRKSKAARKNPSPMLNRLGDHALTLNPREAIQASPNTRAGCILQPENKVVHGERSSNGVMRFRARRSAGLAKKRCARRDEKKLLHAMCEDPAESLCITLIAQRIVQKSFQTNGRKRVVILVEKFAAKT
jgi:hypothetical protein